MGNILLFAAGSLRRAFAPLLESFQTQTCESVDVVFGPAGLLRQQIENGERPHIFASANLAHPQQLVEQHLSARVEPFAQNRLCATVRNIPELTEPPLLEVLLNPRWRVATSTPGADPCGDYAQQLFERLELLAPGQGHSLRRRAQTLVGGRDSLPVPAGRPVAEYLLHSGQADIFLGYASYGALLAGLTELAVRQLPPLLTVKADYGLCLLDARAQRLAEFILAEQGQEILRENGFLPV